MLSVALNNSIFKISTFQIVILLSLFLFSTLSHATPINAVYVNNMLNLQPADPGGRSSDSLLGVDANNNGVRDDVERWIATAFPQNAIARAVALQLGLAMQHVMAGGEDVDEVRSTSLKKQIRDGLECLMAVADDNVQAKIFGEFLTVIINTPARARLIERLEEKYPEPNGTVLSEPSPSACLISPDELSNKEKI